MFVWYISKHWHNSILGLFGSVWECFEASWTVSERFGASRSGLESLNASRALWERVGAIERLVGLGKLCKHNPTCM